MQIGEQLLPGAESVIFLSDGLFDLDDQVSSGEHLVRGVDNPSASRDVLLVGKTAARPGAALHHDLAAVIGQLGNPIGLHRHSAFLVLDFLRHTNDQRGHARSPSFWCWYLRVLLARCRRGKAKGQRNDHRPSVKSPVMCLVTKGCAKPASKAGGSELARHPSSAGAGMVGHHAQEVRAWSTVQCCGPRKIHVFSARSTTASCFGGLCTASLPAMSWGTRWRPQRSSMLTASGEFRICSVKAWMILLVPRRRAPSTWRQFRR